MKPVKRTCKTVARNNLTQIFEVPNNDVKNLSGLHDFLSTIPKSTDLHGKKYHYCSPHSDLLGWIIERVSGEKF